MEFLLNFLLDGAQHGAVGDRTKWYWTKWYRQNHTDKMSPLSTWAGPPSPLWTSTHGRHEIHTKKSWFLTQATGLLNHLKPLLCYVMLRVPKDLATPLDQGHCYFSVHLSSAVMDYIYFVWCSTYCILFL